MEDKNMCKTNTERTITMTAKECAEYIGVRYGPLLEMFKAQRSSTYQNQ
ncbi:MAG: hypothetical protein ACYCX4_13515 [Bacillota bacterium]